MKIDAEEIMREIKGAMKAKAKTKAPDPLDAIERLVVQFPRLSHVAEEIMREIKANNAKLDSCVKPHDFSEVAETYSHGVPRKYRCTICGGTISAVPDRLWYLRGLTDARRPKP